MTNLWGYGPVQFQVLAGQDYVVELGVPSRGTIKQITLNQLNESDSGTFEIYASEEAATAIGFANAGSSSSCSLDDLSSVSLTDLCRVDADGESLHTLENSITGELTITDGKYVNAAANWVYVNRDGSPSQIKRKLWMRINITGSGSKFFSLSMVIDTHG